MGSYTQFTFDRALADDSNIMISVIIPVYNSEKYLRECLDSIVNQSLINIEIICINDGSTDSSLDILNEYAIKDRRIKVISQANTGVSSVRNAGIKIARGEYIGFVDSDDYVDLDYFEKLYYAAKRNCADIAACSVLRIKNKKKKFLIRCKKEVITSDIKQKYKLLKLPNWSFSCCKIYKTQSLRESGILFREGIFYEDIVFTNTLVRKLKTLVTVPEIKYYYRIHADSITNQTSLKHIEDAQNAAVEIQEFVQTQGTLSGVGKHWHSEKLYELKILGLPIYTKVKYGRIIQHKILSIPILKTKIFNENIDLVYCWVDGNDKDWQNNKNFWSEKTGITTNPCRYIDNEELKYSLRSIMKNIPWVNKIFIITDNQIPAWLDINHPKIRIINHKEIIPKEYLPCFNSELLESFVDEIPELSEYFLYANDDMFIGRPITPDYFFNFKGKPRVFLKRQKWKYLDNCYQKNIIFLQI